MTRTAPTYTVRWRSQVVRANTRLGPPTPAPNAVSLASSLNQLFKLDIKTQQKHFVTKTTTTIATLANNLILHLTTTTTVTHIRLYFLGIIILMLT
jgi:hypothetical protein